MVQIKNEFSTADTLPPPRPSKLFVYVKNNCNTHGNWQRFISKLPESIEKLEDYKAQWTAGKLDHKDNVIDFGNFIDNERYGKTEAPIFAQIRREEVSGAEWKQFLTWIEWQKNNAPKAFEPTEDYGSKRSLALAP